jgi:hypothetical protein
MAEGLRDRLVGAWRLAEFSVTAQDGSVTYPMGEDVEGLIIYTPDGYMSAQLMEPGRPSYASGEFIHGTTEEEAAAAAGYVAYSGPFYADEESRTVRHHMSVSLFPNWIDDTQERFVELEGDTLTISAAPVLVEGSERTPRLIWKRATPNPRRQPAGHAVAVTVIGAVSQLDQLPSGWRQRRTDWNYITAKRLVLVIEGSVGRGTQWVVFEPNDEPLTLPSRNLGAPSVAHSCGAPSRR